MGYKLEKKIGHLHINDDVMINFSNYIGDEFTYIKSRDGKNREKWLDNLRKRIVKEGEAEFKAVQKELEDNAK
jgi:hypothetical protein